MLDCIDPWKIVIHKDQIEQILQGKRVSPITLGLDISNLCNHNCIWCLYDTYKKEHSYNMPKDLIEKAVKEAKEAGILAICLSGGGEPTMNPNINYAILLAHELGIQISINSNGCRLNLLTDDALNALSYIRISLDAGSRRTHDILHRPNSTDNFYTIINNIMHIKEKSKITIGVGYLVHPDNYMEIANIAILLADLGVNYIQIRPLKNITLSTEQLDNVYKQIEWINKSGLSIEVYESFSKMEDTINKTEKCKKCYMNQLVANIGPDGYVYICCELRGIKPIGNIKDNNFVDIWFSQMHFELLNKIDILQCPACKYAKGNEIIERVFLNDKLNMNFI